MDFEYRVTMIVPIYNMENWLAGCLDSLVAQTIDPKDFEILLIDDGSPDNSIDIMREYAEKYPNMKIFRKENEGLSPTRNYGIERAKGKYIMYIDADDTISPETVEACADFFDKHYDEIDLVTYREFPIIDGEEGTPHYRFKTLVSTGVYDLNKFENAFISQTRINVCVKNERENNVLFYWDREFRHEDQRYCIEVVRRKMKIGYVSKGVYYYLHQPDSIVRTYFYAYYIFEKTTEFWEEVFGYYKDTEVPQYIQAMYLNDINWKTTSDILLPYHYSDEKLEEAKQRLRAMLDRVDDDVILAHPAVDNFHRQYFINMKSDNDIKVLEGYNQLAITNHDKLIYDTQKIEIVMLKFRISEGKIHLRAFLKSALFNYIDKPQLYMIKNKNVEKMKEVELRDSSWDYYKAKTKTNRFYAFDQVLDMKGLRSFEFRVMINNKLYDTRYYFMPRAVFNFAMKRLEIYAEGKKVAYEAGVFRLTKEKKKEKKLYMKKLKSKYFKSNKKMWALRRMVLRNSKKYSNVWLYHDCKGVAKDNGYYQFVHDVEQADGVRRYYVINEEEFAAAKKKFPRKYRKYMIKFGSWKHKYLFLSAKKIITAFIEWNNYSPFKMGRYKKFIDVSKRPEIIYLQHGVLHAHVPWKYSLDRLLIDKEVISTHYEKDNLINNYCFTENELLPCGMPRYDHIDPEVKPVNRILYAPSWRKYLISMSGGEWVSTETKFKNSKFFAETSKFLNSKELEKMLEEKDMYLDFKLHPIFVRYKHLYNVTNSRVSLAENTIDETSYRVFMTDFSSFVFDFVYLEKPIIYFFPDEDMFRAGMNDYRQIDIPFEDGFGDFAITSDEAVAAIEKICKNDFKPEKKYADKMKGFFIHYDNNQTSRIYDAIK